MYEAFSLREWIDSHRELLKPPVGNKVIWKDRDFIVMAVGGPNSRTDFHINQGEEFFYQVEGDITLKIRTPDGDFKDIQIKEGDIYLLPPDTPHSPQRPANTIGIVVERKRFKSEKDGFAWYCENCGNLLYEEFVQVNDIEEQLPLVFDRYYSNPDHLKCKNCNHEHARK